MAGKANIRTPMPIKMRAKQFAMFDALKGLTEAITEKENRAEPRRELSQEKIEELDAKLQQMEKGDMITVVYYCQYAMQYRQLSGLVTKIDSYWKVLQINGVIISFDEYMRLVRTLQYQCSHRIA